MDLEDRKRLLLISYFIFVVFSLFIFVFYDFNLGLNLLFDVILITFTYFFIKYVLEHRELSNFKKRKNIAKKILEKDFYTIKNYLEIDYIGEFKNGKYHINKEVFKHSNAIDVFRIIIDKLEKFQPYLEYFDPDIMEKFIDITRTFNFVLNNSDQLMNPMRTMRTTLMTEQELIKIIQQEISKIGKGMNYIIEKESLNLEPDYSPEDIWGYDNNNSL
ncbi:MAG TPA: hypothetical protein ENI51_02395 [Candidatus Atribacteria bacterium]|nr:hypothetical protein [Candidatus Atribacteria bacterium]